jgi:predicted nucleotidyltransferase
MADNLIPEKQQSLERICERHGVSSLAVFGSAVGGDFDPENSDLDFVVEFKPMTPVEHKNAYFGIISDLESLFGRSVDLVEPGTLDNPYVRESIEARQKTIYAAA